MSDAVILFLPPRAGDSDGNDTCAPILPVGTTVVPEGGTPSYRIFCGGGEEFEEEFDVVKKILDACEILENHFDL